MKNVTLSLATLVLASCAITPNVRVPNEWYYQREGVYTGENSGLYILVRTEGRDEEALISKAITTFREFAKKQAGVKLCWNLAASRKAVVQDPRTNTFPYVGVYKLGDIYLNPPDCDMKVSREILLKLYGTKQKLEKIKGF